MSPASFLKLIGQGCWSLVVGLGITIRTMLRPTVTVHYPHKHLTMPPRYRGHIELIRNAETGAPNCVVCMMCEKSCPSHCIAIEGEKKEGAKRKSLTQYRLDFTTCSLCGLCVESCKFDALRFSHEYNLAGTRKDDFIMDLLNQPRKKA